jgi:transposase-like protein
MRKERKHFTPEEKVAILRRHLLDKAPVSELCEELGLRPTVFYRWQKELFENGAAAFQAQERPHRQVEEKQKRIEFLEKKVQTKDEVLAELMAEHIALKKSLGGTLTGIWVSHDVRDLVVDFVRRWSEKTEIGVGRFIPWLGVTASKFYDWRQRYGCANS